MRKLSESFIDDVIRRSRNDEDRDEEKVSNIKDLKPVDMGCSVLWADRDYEEDGEYLFDYNDAYTVENITLLKGWRLPTLKEVDELWKKTRDSYTDHHLTNNGNELIFEKRGLYKWFYYATSSSKKTEYRIMDEGRYYYGWTSDESEYTHHNMFTFDNEQMYYTPLNNTSKMSEVIQPDNDKLCIRLVKDK